METTEDRVPISKEAHTPSETASNTVSNVETSISSTSAMPFDENPLEEGLSKFQSSATTESPTPVDPLEAELERNKSAITEPAAAASTLTHRNTLQSSKVPSSKLGRLFHYGGLAASLGYGAASEFLRPSTSSVNASGTPNRSALLTDANIGRLVSKLSQMRGAALKLGQFLSIQDTHLLPAEVDAVFRRVQDSAHYMPDWQMEQVLSSALGPSWSTEYFEQFNRIPFAAASIGQVHEGVLKAKWSPTGEAEKVAVKVQFPNIRDSISADLSYITWLLRVTLGGKILPKGLFLDRTMEVMKQELTDECNYVREAHFLQQFRSSEFLGSDSRFHVPWVSSVSSEQVLVMEFVEGGVSLGSDLVTALPQNEKDKIATTILHLCLLELFRFGTMQTDPNYSNFLYVPETKKIALIDFGATREYGPEFLDGWRRLLEAAASLDLNSSDLHQSPAWNACVHESVSLGYLIGGPGEGEGFESPEMIEAHVTSLALLAFPFNERTSQPVRFGKGFEFGRNTERIRDLIPVMLRERKKGPPRETYSLNRKLSGAFLLASRLGATIHARDIWVDVL
ncbi:ABC1 family-domain-containing protein [Lentinula lateritia]|uniref:ABC1 family-domain-containing protein n=1 Tax=Lentinula lateritia TaxID=40482 RepID=A0ABQ8VAL4_9AGAR|nr:ABC1 family-domain-containing protein [Lentinula lateritia]